MRKFYLPIICLAFVSVAFTFVLQTSASAQVISHQQARVDDTIAKNDTSFSVPDNIVITPIFPPSADFDAREGDWFRGLYYYMTANERRPGFTDIPFHYIVTSDGRVFRGNSGGEERKISVTDLGSSMVMIGYLAGRSDNAFDPRAKDVLGELVIDICNRNSINPDKVSVASVKYRLDDETKTVSLERQDLFGLWNTSKTQVVDAVKALYAPVPKSYALHVVEVNMPTEAVNPGETAVGTIKIKNVGEFGSYFDSTSEIIGTHRNGGSKFYLQDVWPSTSQFHIMKDGDSLLPGEERSFDFRVYVPLFIGEVYEEYDIYTIGGQKIPDSGFAVKLNVNRPSGRIVEVKATETGWLRVRSQPSGAATEIGRVSTGERYFVTDDAGNGWIKIKLTNGTEGWVSSQYLTFL
jgi:hypothetical protein